MDTAGSDSVRTAVTQQGALLGQHEVRLTNTSREVDFLGNQVAELTARIQELQHDVAQGGQAAPGPHYQHEPRCNIPPPYDGDPNSCRAFLSQCSDVFALQPRTYATEETKVAFVLTLLTGKARDWGISVWDTQAPCCTSFDEFRQEMIKLFDRSARGQEAADQLARLRQAGRSVTEYAIQFKTLAVSCDWNQGACRSMFRAGLEEVIQDELATIDLPHDFDDLINMALRVEGRLRRRHQLSAPRSPWRTEDTFPVSDASNSASAGPEPMQVGRLRLTPQEKQHRLAKGLCLYCGKPGHFAATCPLKGTARQ